MGGMLVYVVAAARGGNAALWDDGMFFVYYSISVPAGVFSAVHLIRIWIDSLPSKVNVVGMLVDIGCYGAGWSSTGEEICL